MRFIFYLIAKGSRPRTTRVFICFIFLFLQQAIAFSQLPFIIQHYTNENGLPANGIKGIELDKTTGFLWVGTQAGLVRFDGRHFTDAGFTKNSLVSSRINFIAQNREGTIYCEDDNFSVYRIVNNRQKFVTTDTLLADPFWLRGGGSQVTPTQITERLKRHPRSSYLPDWMLFDDEPGDSSSFTFLYLWHPCHYNAAKDTLVCYNETFQQVFKLDGATYFVNGNLDLWIYNDSLMKLEPVSLKGMPDWNRHGNEKPRFIWKPGMKDPLMIYKRDISTLHGKGDSLYLQPFCQGCSPMDAYIIGVQVWEERGIIFLASEQNGLYVVRSSFLRSIRTDTLIKAGRAEYAQAEIIPGMITTGYGLSFSAQGKLSYQKGGMQFHPYVIYKDQYGDHFFHTGDTIIHLYAKDGRHTKIPTNTGTVKMVFAETQKRLYVVTHKIIAEITGDQYRPLYELPQRANALKNSLNPDAAIEWKPGVLAIAAETLLFFDTQKKQPDTIQIPGLTAKVRSLLKYRDYLLIATYGQGFYMYKNGIVKKMPLDKSRYLATSHCFLPDAKGYCWISTNHGLFKVSLDALVKAYENDLPEIYYHYFGKDDGIFNTEFNGGCQPCALQMGSGLYSFPTMNGMVVFDPSQQHSPPPAGKVFVDEVQADTLSCEAGDPMLNNLPYPIRNLRFSIVVPHFGNLENIYFSYKLEPFTDKWQTQDILQNNILQFGSLPPGHYKLYMQVRNGFDPDQFEVTVIEFRILKAWYQRWWFYLLCALGFIAVTWALVRWRTANIAKRKKELQQQVAEQTKNLATQGRQLESQVHQLQSQQQKLEVDNRVKARLIAIISHDMITPLKFMVMVSKKLKSAFATSDPSYNVAESLVTVTLELESLSVNMLNWIRFHHDTDKLKPERFNLHELVSESTEIASTLANEKGVKLYNDVPGSIYIYQHKQAIGVIVYNLVMNAMKHTQRGEIRIACQPVGDDCSIIVTDTGSGMPQHLVDLINSNEAFIADYSAGEAKKFSFGYLIIKDLLRLVNGNIKVKSGLNKGTQVITRFGSIGEDKTGGHSL